MDTDSQDPKIALLKQALSAERVVFLEQSNKRDALLALIDVLAASPEVGDRELLAEAVFRREKLMSTGIGLGLAVPHVRIPSVNRITMAVGISRQGLSDYESLDDQPVHLVFLVAASVGHHAEHLRLLSAISTRAKILDRQLLEAASAEAFYALLVGEDSLA